MYTRLARTAPTDLSEGRSPETKSILAMPPLDETMDRSANTPFLVVVSLSMLSVSDGAPVLLSLLLTCLSLPH